MAFDDSQPGSDEWLLMKLITELGEGLPRIHRLRRYRDGAAMLPVEGMDASQQEAYIRFARMSRLHMVELLRDARTSRQRVVGFRTADDGDIDGDARAYDLWRASHMPSRQSGLFNDVADFGRAYIIVDWPEPGQFPVFRSANGGTVAVREDRRRPWLADAAVEVGYEEESGYDIVRFWRRDEDGRVRVRVAQMQVGERSTIPTDLEGMGGWRPRTEWEWRSFDGQTEIVTGWSEVPVVPVSTPSGFGVWERHIDTIDRINYTTLQLMQMEVTQAFRQAAISADLPEVYPDDDPFGRAGQAVRYSEIFKLGPAALWRLPEGGRLHEFSPVDPRPIKEIRDDDIKKLAAFSATPYYMLSSDSANNSAEGASLAADMLNSNVSDMNATAEIGLAYAQALAFESVGDRVRSDVTRIECIWAPLKRPSLQEMGSAAAQARQGGATQRWVDEHVFQMTPSERIRARNEREEEAFALGALEVTSGDAV